MIPNAMPRPVDGSVFEDAGSSRLESPIGGRRKRIFDVVFASCAIIALAPLLIMIVALLKARGGGTVLYKHRRVGFGGREFLCLKFRTMAVNSDELLHDFLSRDADAAREWAETQKLRNDPRISKLGRFLRRSSLDELPQLYNILRGEMSVVGPRPVTQSELARYGTASEFYKQARPGLTGLWQVSRTDDMPYETRVTLDVDYVVGRTAKQDLTIITRTVRVVLAGQGAC